MQNIEEQALQTYNDNIIYLQSKHPTLFNRLVSLDTAIEKGYYKERYSLEYKNNYFDVVENKTQKWLYNSDSNKHAKTCARSINFNKVDNVYETFRNFDPTDQNMDELEDLSIEQSTLSGSARLIDYSYKNANKDNTSMKKIYKFIFIGTSLGLHISEIHKKIQSNIYYIVEDDLELFKLSLFVTNYKEIADSGSLIIFSVFDDEEEFKKNTQAFLEQNFVYNHFIKFFAISDEKG